jgi:hypothetical protein
MFTMSSHYMEFFFSRIGASSACMSYAALHGVILDFEATIGSTFFFEPHPRACRTRPACFAARLPKCMYNTKSQ